MQTIGKQIALAVFGTRTYTNKDRVYFELNELRKLYRIVNIISGVDILDIKAKGVDSFARDYAIENKIPYIGYPADWKDMAKPCLERKNEFGVYNALAGLNRNTKIANRADCGLAFWDRKSKGTADTIEKLKQLTKKIKIVYV